MEHTSRQMRRRRRRGRVVAFPFHFLAALFIDKNRVHLCYWVHEKGTLSLSLSLLMFTLSMH